MPTFIHGVASCSAIDTSAEVIDIAGLDISSLAKTGTITFEHNMAKEPTGKSFQLNIPCQIVGKIVQAKKIFSEKDCDTESERYFWNKTKLSYVYIIAELLDDYTASAKEVAGMFRYSKDHPGQSAILGFSVEGGEIPGTRSGVVVKRSIARKTTLTTAPCNKLCIAEIYDAKMDSQVKDDFESLFKTETMAIELFKSDQGYKMYERFLAKREETDLMKAEPKGIPHGWTPSAAQHPKLGTVVSISHPQHGTVSVYKNPENSQYEVKHAGKLAGVKGTKGSFGTNAEAISHAQKFVHGLHSGKILGRDITSMSSNPKGFLGKSLDAGSGNAAPTALSGGAVYQTENLGSKKKTDWNKRAKQEYDQWPQKEKFESFMKARLPHLHEGEIRAIGRVISLNKSLDFESALDKLTKK